MRAAGVGCDPLRQSVTNLSLFNRTWIVLVWRGAAKRRLDSGHTCTGWCPTRRSVQIAPRPTASRVLQDMATVVMAMAAEAVGIARGLPSNVQAKASTLHASDAPSNRARPSTAKADTR